jgi:hypothetical protein
LEDGIIDGIVVFEPVKMGRFYAMWIPEKK